MMRRKFSLANIPLLNIGPSRSNERQLRDQLLLSPTDSRPSTPKSVRPPLPGDVLAELRAACTYIVTHPKPSHQIWTTDAPKPALDYAAVKYDAECSTGAPAVKPSARSRSAAPRNENATESAKYSYRPNVATEELFIQDPREQVPTHVRARSRVEQLMAPEPVKIVTTQAPLKQQQIQPDLQQLAPAARNETSDKKRISTRSDSVGTTGSTPHTDTTDYPWSASTPMTSAAITPARGSKRASSQNITGAIESGSAPKVDPVNAEWMRAEFEKHKKALEEREREKDRERDAETTRRVVDSTRHVDLISASRVPPRKPVPSRPESRQEADVTQPDVRQGRSRKATRDYPPISYRGRSESSRPVADRTNPDAEAERRGRGTQRSSSRLGKSSRAASRAASKAGSITNDIITHYFAPGSAKDAKNDQNPVSPTERRRSPSRARNISTHIKDYMKSSRPGTAMGSRKHSMDTGRGHARSGSTDSLHSSVSKATESSSRWRNWHPLKKTRTQASTPDGSRPGSSGSAIKSRNAPSERQSSPKTKQTIDLNRELPPLPGLDQWKDEGAESGQLQSAPAPARATPYSGLRRALSRKRDKNPSAQPAQSMRKEDIIAARLGSPTPPRSQKQSVDVQRYEPGYPSPPVSISPDMRSLDPRLGQMSLSRSTTPLPPNTAHRYEQRLRSKSNQSARPDLLRNTSSPPETYQATGSPNLSCFPQPPSSGQPVTGKHRSEMHNGYGASSTSVNSAYDHSRTNSDRMHTTQKHSANEYTSAEGRYQQSLAIPQDQDKSRRKWWQGKDKRQANWMDQVARSGARNGMLLQDDSAEPPVIRY